MADPTPSSKNITSRGRIEDPLLITEDTCEELTGISADYFTTDLLRMAQDRAKTMLGGLYEVEKTKTLFSYRSQAFFNLDELEPNVTAVATRGPGATEFTEVDEDLYRFVADQKLLVFSSVVAEDTEVQITYTVGWTAENLPNLVKLLLALVSLDVLNQLRPGIVSSGEVVQKTLGDYSVRYQIPTLTQVSGDRATQIDTLVTLIKQGPLEPGGSV